MRFHGNLGRAASSHKRCFVKCDSLIDKCISDDSTFLQPGKVGRQFALGIRTVDSHISSHTATGIE